MAVTVSGYYLITFKDMWDNSDLVWDYINDVCKMALYTNSLTAPNFDTDTAYAAAPYTSNEIPNGSGYSTGGVALASKTLTISSGTLQIDAQDPAWTSSTFSGVRAGLIWDDTTTTPNADAALCLVNFGADYAVTAGTLTVTLAATGWGTIDFTP